MIKSDAPFFSKVAMGPPGGFAKWLSTEDDKNIRLGIWRNGRKGTVLIFPGRGEFIEKYGAAADLLSKKGYSVMAIDWRGQGLSDRLHKNHFIGHIKKYSDYQKSRSDWGMDVLKGIFIEVTTESGHQGYATAYGGYISSWIIKNHLMRFLIGADARNLNLLYDQMYRASIPYSGQNGVVINTIAGIDLALWDLIGKVRQEPVYMMIGGKVRDTLQTYVTGPEAKLAQDWGHVGSKIPLPYGPGDGIAGLKKNQEYIMETRKQVGADYRLMVDCYICLLYTSPSPRDATLSRMPSSA